MTRMFYGAKLIGAAALGAAQMLTFAGCDGTGEPVSAAPAVPDLQGVEQVAFSGKGEIELRQGAPSLRIDSRDADEIELSREGDRLRIEVPARVDGTPKFVLSLPGVRHLELSGAAKVHAQRLQVQALRVEASGATKFELRDLRADALQVASSGAGSFELAGQVREQRIDMAGASEYDASGLVSQVAQVEASGATHLKVRVDSKLALDASGAGSLEYAGNPAVDQDVTGLFRVRHIGG